MISMPGFRGKTPSATDRAGQGPGLPLKLALVLALAGAAFPLIQASRQPEPWLASVTLGLDGRSGDAAAKTLDLALREVRTSKVLGRAVDILGLDRDPEFSGSASTGLGVALEILTGEGSGPADARRRAIQHLQSSIGLERKPGSTQARLLVKASEQAKALRIAEAIATVYAAGSELTGSIPPVASEAAAKRLETAQAALADFTSKAGAAKLSDVLVLKSRMEGLDSHINAVSSADARSESALAKASLKDVLDGRVPLAEADPQLDTLRQSYLSARMAADALAVSLGPKHPRLLAAQSTAETARQALADQLARTRKRLGQADAERASTLKSLQAARADLARQIDAAGIDLGRHAALSAEVAAARKAYESSADAAASGREPVFEASVPQPVETPDASLPFLRIGLGAAAGTALAITLAAWRRQSRPVPAPPEEQVLAAAEAPAPPAPARRVESVMAAAPPPAVPVVPAAEAGQALPAAETLEPRRPAAVPLPHAESIVCRLEAIRARSRTHDAANAVPPAMPLPPGLDPVAPEDLPLIDKLRQVAPHVFAEPPDEPEVERLRQELADLRARVMIRKASAA